MPDLLDAIATSLHVEIVAERPDNNLPCDVCGECGGIVVIKIAYETYDVCDSRAKGHGIRW
jgi:hypothetical protein